MKKILLCLVFMIYSAIIFCQCTLSLTNPQVIGITKYRVDVNISNVGSTSFNLGSCSFRLGYSQTIISKPIITSNSFIPPAFMQTTTTGSNSSTGLFAINTIHVNGSCSSSPFLQPNTPFYAFTIEFDILNPIVISNTNPTNYISISPTTTIRDCNNSTITLPIELVGFGGTDNENINSFIWEVTERSEVDKFILERSGENLNNFKEIYSISRDNSRKEIESIFKATDNNPLNFAYYRLKMISEKNNEILYSAIIGIANNYKNYKDFSVRPNPFHNSLILDLFFKNLSELKIEINDISGNTIKRIDTPFFNGKNSINITTDDLPCGIYILTVSNGIHTLNEKIIKI